MFKGDDYFTSVDELVSISHFNVSDTLKAENFSKKTEIPNLC